MKALLASFFLMMGVHLFADAPAVDYAAESFNFKSELINMLATLVFVLLLVFVTVWFLKKLMRSRMRAHNISCGIKILERRTLSPKASLYLVDILGKGVVLSESPNGVHLITEFPDSHKIEEIYSNSLAESKPTSPFSELFKRKA